MSKINKIKEFFGFKAHEDRIINRKTTLDFIIWIFFCICLITITIYALTYAVPEYKLSVECHNFFVANSAMNRACIMLKCNNYTPDDYNVWSKRNPFDFNNETIGDLRPLNTE